MSEAKSAIDVKVTAYELDDNLHPYLRETLAYFKTIKSEVIGGDFIENAANQYLIDHGEFTHVIMNPPYKKINIDSPHRKFLRAVGIETVNLYTGFAGLALKMLQPHGHLVAIIPRSFCNGPYYKSFRNFLISENAIRHIHIFESRSKAFREDEVLQENIIIVVEKHGEQKDILVTSSRDGGFADVKSHRYPFTEIVKPGNGERFIYIPGGAGDAPVALPLCATERLADLGLGVCTGPVVDFRLKKHLLKEYEAGAAPLLYPGHFDGYETRWPKPDFKKWNYIRVNEMTQKWLMKAGTYAVVRRFSAKEERRRVYSSVLRRQALGNAAWVGVENHLNVLHCEKGGLTEELAFGLTTYLNSTAVDNYFRLFNGHTQVNATDLRQIKYPPKKILEQIGRWAIKKGTPSQDQIDQKLSSYEQSGPVAA